MFGDPWWVWLLPLVFAAPWLAGIAYVCLRTPRREDGVPPSAAQAALRRF